jgi:predicted metal-binding membrane protein
MPSQSPVAAVSRRDRVLISTCLVVVTALAWAYLVHLGRQMSASMEHETMMAEMGMPMHMPWTATDVWFTFAMWAVMMVGMMTGTAAPVLFLFAGARSARGERGVPLAVLMFAGGYLMVWVGFSVTAALAQWKLHEAAMLSPAMAAASPLLAGAILAAAGAYQITPLKVACLTHCRSPLGFLMTHWRDGLAGALRMGLRHGTYCLGCCWALMSVLFVVGVMNLTWVAVLTAFVLLEKTGPAGVIVARIAGAAMVVVGILIIAGVAAP